MGQIAPGRQCQWDHCEKEARYRLEAQWSLFDFNDYQACADHLSNIRRWLAQRLVDGQPPVETNIVTPPVGETIPLPPER